MIPLDKLLHFLTGYMIADIAEPIGFWSVGIALLAGLLKEVYDQWKYGGFDLRDMLMTFVGGFINYCISQLWII